MDILVACEYSGRVRDAFAARGHNAWSCDFLDSETQGNHYKGDVREILGLAWDMLIAHPECTYLCNSGVRWLTTEEGRYEKLDEAAAFYNLFLDADHIPKRVIENPVMHRYAKERLTHYNGVMSFQPWQHGHKELKRTCLQLVGVPPLEPSDVVGPPPSDPRERAKWAVVHRMSPGPDRWKNRSRTYEGVANAMAAQWG